MKNTKVEGKYGKLFTKISRIAKSFEGETKFRGIVTKLRFCLYKKLRNTGEAVRAALRRRGGVVLRSPLGHEH